MQSHCVSAQRIMKETSADGCVHQEDNFAIRCIERFQLIDVRKDLVSPMDQTLRGWSPGNPVPIPKTFSQINCPLFPGESPAQTTLVVQILAVLQSSQAIDRKARSGTKKVVSWHGLHEIRSHCLINMDLHIFIPRLWKQLLHGTLGKESHCVPGICFQLWTVIPQDQLCKEEQQYLPSVLDRPVTQLVQSE